MGVTRLKRKDRKNKARANNKVAKIKQLLSTPVIKNVDVEELKAQFNTTDKPAAKAPAPAEKAPQAPVAAEEAKQAPAAEEAPADGKETVTTVEAEAPGIDEGPAVDGDLETPAQTFVENQLADTNSSASAKDIKSAQQLEDEENNTPA